MSLLSKFLGYDAAGKALGLKKLKTPAVKPAEDPAEYEYDPTAYLKEQERKEGFEDQIKTGRKKKLAAQNYLGVSSKSKLAGSPNSSRSKPGPWVISQFGWSR